MNQPDMYEAARLAQALDAVPDDRAPLVVDLDGTLLQTDTLIESLLVLVRMHPLDMLKLPFWLARGRAYLKRCLAERAPVDVQTLPWTPDLLEFLQGQKRQGRKLVLATGADESIARAVARQTGVFEEIFASDGVVNLSDSAKGERLVAEFGFRGFDYVGNSSRDLPVWASARRGLLVGRSQRLARRVSRVTRLDRVFALDPPLLSTYLGAMRSHHWVKNLLVFVPLLAAHRLFEPAMLAPAMLGFVCFCLAASGIYLLNDLLDLPSDRRHPHKRARALASGRIPLLHALTLILLLWLSATALSLTLSPWFTLLLAVYINLMVTYSMRLKDIPILDAVVLGIGYVLRVLGGSVAAGIDVSIWLLAAVGGFFLGLAFLKRYAELVAHRTSHMRPYRERDARVAAVLGVAACCGAVVAFASYPILEPSGHASWPVWVLSVCLLLWSGRMWWMAHRGGIKGDPVTFALQDRISRAFGLATAATVLAAALVASASAAVALPQYPVLAGQPSSPGRVDRTQARRHGDVLFWSPHAFPGARNNQGVSRMPAQTTPPSPGRKPATSISPRTRKPSVVKSSAEAPAAHTSKVAVDLAAREESIRRRAYAFYQDRGHLDGSALDDWLAAEEEIDRATPEGVRPLPLLPGVPLEQA